MKKIVLSLCISIFSFAGFVSANEVDLEQCSSYYDGCNTCSVIGGEIGACTERYCIRYDESKCLVPKTDNESKEEVFCEKYDGVYEDSSKSCYFGNHEINAQALYNSYLDFSGQMMYMGGSKYFDESTGFYDYDLVASDLEILWFVRLNISELYNDYKQNIDMKINSLQDKVDSQDKIYQQFQEVLGKKILDRVDVIVKKYYDKTSGMSYAKRDKYIKNKIEKIENLQNDYKSNKKVLVLLGYFVYRFENLGE